MGVCEHIDIRRFVQKELIRTIFLQSGITINKKEGGRVQTENNRKMCKHIKIKNNYLSHHSLCPTTEQEQCQIRADELGSLGKLESLENLGNYTLNPLNSLDSLNSLLQQKRRDETLLLQLFKIVND